MNKKKPIILAVAILLAIMTAASASTFAWFTAQDEVNNRIQTASLTDGDVSIIETFDPEDPLMPGVDINKDVGAINTGDAPALVRISFAEALTKLLPMDPDPVEARYLDMRVRNASKFTSAAAFIPQLVDIGRFEADFDAAISNPTDPALWRDISTFTTFTGQALFDYEPLTPANESADNLAQLTGALGITILYKRTTTVAPHKYSFTAYAALGTTPETYQNVELRPELLNMVRVPGTNPAVYALQVMTDDPATGSPEALYDNITGYPVSGKPAAYGNNGDGRFYNFITLELDNGGAPRTVDWRKGAVAAVLPMGKTHPDASDYVQGSLVAPITPGRMPAVTNRGNTYMEAGVSKYFLELLFHSANVSTTAAASLSASDVNKWWYNQADGFFYYIGVVEPGEATPLLLDAISLAGAAESDYSHVKFDLTVHMDAIQATKEAVVSTAGGGWGANYYLNAGTIPFAPGLQTGSILPPQLIAVLQGVCPT